MAGTSVTLNVKEFEALQKAIANFGTGAGQVIDGVLSTEGAELIKSSIMQFLPVSGRTWKGKKPAASSTMPFESVSAPLSITVMSKKAYNYLYFPDDGSNTRRHVGQQQFMQRGAEEVTDEIIQKCINALIKSF